MQASVSEYEKMLAREPFRTGDAETATRAAAARGAMCPAHPIAVGDHAWIGANATVLPGVTIVHRSTIGAGSVVTRSIPPDVLAAGNPCRVIRRLEPSDISNRTLP